MATDMFFHGKIASPEHSAGTLLALVTKQLAKTSTIHCGRGDVRILGLPKDGDATLLALMRCMHRVTAAAHKLVDAVTDPQLFGNSLECFDVVQWVEVLKAQSTAENTEHSRITEDRLLGLYRKYCSGRGWEPKPCAFRVLMFEAAKVCITENGKARI